RGAPRLGWRACGVRTARPHHRSDAGRPWKPTEGFEPSTPALRERCSGQLSYVGATRAESSPAYRPVGGGEPVASARFPERAPLEVRPTPVAARGAEHHGAR